MLPNWLLIIAFIFSIIKFSIEKENFYDLLGVPNNADTRTIRKAFKKIAIVKHPDKNKDDPNAHAEFVRINRAYEVLKDEELRKKYDEHGEEGLDSNFNANQQYQSWQFYKDNFGIYDEDVEIVTLSRADFQDEVTESNDFWFINFYSTFCSHCHALAPAWREFAKAMDGIIRIGAVNCAEDPALCQSQHVMGYPSLVVYPEHAFYQGPRDVDRLIDFIISKMTSSIYELKSPIDASAISQKNGLPFVVEYCGDEKPCLTLSERKKAASMLNDIANFGVVHCMHAKDFCSSFLSEKVAFYPLNGFEKSREKEIEFTDLKELYVEVVKQIPKIEHLESEQLKNFLTRNVEFEENTPEQNVLVVFFNNLLDEEEHSEYKKLLTYSPKVKRIVQLCAANAFIGLHLNNLPKAVLFRASGGFDIHYGSKLSVREVKKFLHKSLPSSLIALTDENYREAFEKYGGDILLIDHFAPWCPPCLRLIQELRKLPSSIAGRKLRVTTLDCEAYKSICSNANINSYPTSVVHANGAHFTSIGYHSAEHILEFIEESLSPSVGHFTYQSFQDSVVNRAPNHVAVVDFYVGWCGPCQQLAPEFRKLARSFRNNSDVVSFGMVDCEAQRSLCAEMGIRSYPAITLFDGVQNSNPKHYPPNWWRDFKSMQHWVNEQLPSLVERITGDYHTQILGSTIPILVDYYAPWCGHCVRFAPILENIAKLLEGEIRVGKVNCDMTPHLCQTASVQAYPSLRLYLGSSMNQDTYGVAIQPEPNAQYVVNIIKNILERNGITRIDYKDKDEL